MILEGGMAGLIAAIRPALPPKITDPSYAFNGMQ